MVGHGPSSNAWRAAPTAFDMSASLASATLKKSCSVAESITSIVASEDGFTHSPPTKNRSGLRSGAVASVVLTGRSLRRSAVAIVGVTRPRAGECRPEIGAANPLEGALSRR
jgi:hypothetical protein